VALLEQLRELLSRMPPSVYRACPAPRVSGSIGEHVRHCLDHVDALASAGVMDDLSYDHRQRGTRVEADPDAAVAQIEHLTREVHVLACQGLARSLQVSSVLARGGAADTSRSSLGRELAFVVSHTTHHLAIIALLLDQLGWQGPDGFGLAASSPQRH
jgi:uncharacterized damage-inducible protein DinB